ncbi:MAPEG family protein [uncultured Parasphingorhabdus sp.]|uniref:MAPEG family protein n=1 Tax=uncultured Parasphingorhabdus sp. TaxID=2709694 RepID=UPI002AA64889|nr:MAPEG family protein [uncultured Parasphingorhabdus sp.]
MEIAILAPAAVLVLWSLIMLFWVAATRFPAMAKSGADLGSAKPGGRGSDLEGVIPDKVNWKAHNYTHLMEQPTLFYATVVILALAGAGHGMNLYLAWAYVIIRIVHSIWQATVNLVKVRFLLFILSTVCLLVMAVNALWATLF